MAATLSVPHPVPSAYEDAERLFKACKGWGTDEEEIIAVLAHRDATQRMKIRIAYEEQHNENLIKRLERELSGHLERAVYRWIFDPIERLAIIANTALKKKNLDGYDFRAIVEIACVSSPKELLLVKEAYHARYKRSLEEDVAVCTTGDFRQLLVSLVSTYRYGGDEVDASVVRQEAGALQDAVERQDFGGHCEIVRILSTRSKAQLRATFNCYKEEYGTSLTKALATGSANELAHALRTAIRCIAAPQKYFVKLLQHAISKGGDEDDVLTRVIVTRAEKDLMVIKEMFYKRSNITLEDAVGTETSGHYKSFLLALMGN